ncbi:MAG: ATP phosphoribosyltransferase regulatory subunit [Gammaproteobacteria bacterium]|nr:ATP phosphoribosyltransferase regulatory subunit [Gammaproteobacteria bacterium]
MANRNWRLPDGVDELLPPAAWGLEQVRREVLDVFHGWGFDYIEPPIIEYLDALLAGTGPDRGRGHQDDLDLQTLKVVDQRSGRMLGVRSDLTAQAVRIDAHSRPRAGVQRLCYAGAVVHANPAAALDSRVPIKAGAEIFGADGVSADAEVIALLLEVLRVGGIPEPVLVLGHMGIYLSLVEPLGLDADAERDLFAAVQSKSEADIAQLLRGRPQAALIERLPTLMGGREVLAAAQSLFRDAPAQVSEATAALTALADEVEDRCAGVVLRFDLAELAGYGYHNGPVFSAYQADLGRALARGGRYDGIGAVFGRGRPATGFDVSLTQLVGELPAGIGIWAPWLDNPTSVDQVSALAAEVKALRAAGERVVAALDAADTAPPDCDRQLRYAAGAWNVVKLDEIEAKAN